MFSRNNFNNSPLWGITTFFNPCQYQSKLANYRIFRKFLPIPLLAVELSFNARFELGYSDADILIQIHGGDVMWQKERLLNIALKSLPETCDKVTWLDCDLVFTKDNWQSKVCGLLDDYKMIQPYKTVKHLPPGIPSTQYSSLAEIMAAKPILTEPSYAYSLVAGESLSGERRPTSHEEIGAVGVMWAARKDLLQQHSFYDACIIGGSDTVIALSASGRFDELKRKNIMNDHQFEHFMDWAKPFYHEVKGSIHYVDYEVFHLWHGEFNDRCYSQRHEILKKYCFNPFTDITHDSQGCWKWNCNKTELQQCISSYFNSRKEDGDAMANLIRS